MDQQINSNYTIELDEMRQRLEAEAGVVVYFEAVHSQSILTAATLRESLPLDVLYDSPDGDVYALAAER